MANNLKDPVWLYIRDKKKFICLERSDDRLDWTWAYSSPGTVKFQPRRGSEKWHYEPFGSTPQEAANNENQYTNKQIQALRNQIEALQNTIVLVPDDLLGF